jgi:magnesium transporter
MKPANKESTAQVSVSLSSGSMEERRRILLETIGRALAQEGRTTLQLVLNGQRSADLAAVFGLLTDQEQLRCLRALAEPLAAETLADMNAVSRLDLTAELDDETLSGLVEEMAPDDAADMLGDLPVKQSESVLGLMEADDAADLRQLLTHPEDTGGGIMTSRLLSVKAEDTVAEAVEQLRQWAEEDEVFYLYVIDEADRLAGTVPLKELLPVVDGENRPIGLVTIDDVVDVIHDEATQDMYEMAAITSDQHDQRSAMSAVRRRLPWPTPGRMIRSLPVASVLP